MFNVRQTSTPHLEDHLRSAATTGDDTLTPRLFAQKLPLVK